MVAAYSRKQSTESLLRRDTIAARNFEVRRYLYGNRPSRPFYCSSEWYRINEPFQLLRSDIESCERLPLVPFVNVHCLFEGRDLFRSHQAGVIILMSSKRQSITLDGIKYKASRPVVIYTVKRLDNRFQ